MHWCKQKWSFSLLNKKELRKSMREKRRAVPVGVYDAAGLAAKQLLMASPLFHSSRHIACYFGQDEEFDCAPIIEEVWLAGKLCYLPVVSSQHPECLEFVVYQPNAPLRLNRYNIFEPESGDKVAAEKLDLVIVPLVAFDEHGHRVGMGGGHYDRTFAFKQTGVEKPKLLGLGYEFQRVDGVPSEDWDVVLDGVLTEEKLRTVL